MVGSWMTCGYIVFGQAGLLENMVMVGIIINVYSDINAMIMLTV